MVHELKINFQSLQIETEKTINIFIELLKTNDSSDVIFVRILKKLSTVQDYELLIKSLIEAFPDSKSKSKILKFVKLIKKNFPDLLQTEIITPLIKHRPELFKNVRIEVLGFKNFLVCLRATCVDNAQKCVNGINEINFAIQGLENSNKFLWLKALVYVSKLDHFKNKKITKISNVQLYAAVINNYLVVSSTEILTPIFDSNLFDIEKLSISELSELMVILKDVYQILNIPIRLNDSILNELHFGSDNYIDCDIRSIIMTNLTSLIPYLISKNINFNRSSLIKYFNDTDNENQSSRSAIFTESKMFHPDDFQSEYGDKLNDFLIIRAFSGCGDIRLLNPDDKSKFWDTIISCLRANVETLSASPIVERPKVRILTAVRIGEYANRVIYSAPPDQKQVPTPWSDILSNDELYYESEYRGWMNGNLDSKLIRLVARLFMVNNNDNTTANNLLNRYGNSNYSTYIENATFLKILNLVKNLIMAENTDNSDYNQDFQSLLAFDYIGQDYRDPKNNYYHEQPNPKIVIDRFRRNLRTRNVLNKTNPAEISTNLKIIGAEIIALALTGFLVYWVVTG